MIKSPPQQRHSSAVVAFLKSLFYFELRMDHKDLKFIVQLPVEEHCRLFFIRHKFAV